MKSGGLPLFVSGVFFGGAIDHLILVAMGSEMTPYGLRVGVGGNWGFAVLDFTAAALLYVLYRRKARQVSG